MACHGISRGSELFPISLRLASGNGWYGLTGEVSFPHVCRLPRQLNGMHSHQSLHNAIDPDGETGVRFHEVCARSLSLAKI